MSYEIPGAKAAIIQALRYHFKLSLPATAAIMGITPNDVSWACRREKFEKKKYPRIIPWVRREYKMEAIKAAAAILEQK